MTIMNYQADEAVLFHLLREEKGIYSLSAEESVLVLKCYLDGKSVFQCADQLRMNDRDVMICYEQINHMFQI